MRNLSRVKCCYYQGWAEMSLNMLHHRHKVGERGVAELDQYLCLTYFCFLPITLWNASVLRSVHLNMVKPQKVRMTTSHY